MRSDDSAAREPSEEVEMADEGGARTGGEGPEAELDVATPREEEVARLTAELEESRDRYLRLAAEYDNFRRRTERERVEMRERAEAQLVGTLLEAVDDLHRVADFTAESTTIDALIEGVQLVENKLLKALEAAGLEALESEGKPFDPELHEALMVASTEDPEEDDTVGAVFQRGYLFRGALLRPARVQVRKLDA